LIEAILKYKRLKTALKKVKPYIENFEAHFIIHEKGIIELRVNPFVGYVKMLKEDGFMITNKNWELLNHAGRECDKISLLCYLRYMSAVCLNYYSKRDKGNVDDFLSQITHYAWFVFGRGGVPEVRNQAWGIFSLFDKAGKE